MLLGLDVLIGGLARPFRLEFGMDTLLVFAAAATLADALTMPVLGLREGEMPYCAAIILGIALLLSLIHIFFFCHFETHLSYAFVGEEPFCASSPPRPGGHTQCSHSSLWCRKRQDIFCIKCAEKKGDTVCFSQKIQ